MTTIRTQGLEFEIIGPARFTEVFDVALADLVAAPEEPVRDPIVIEVLRSGARSWRLIVSGSVTLDGGSMAMVVAEVLVAINAEVARWGGTHGVALHAGAFMANGSAIAVCGSSGAGKSTLVAASVLAGFSFVADEVCNVDVDRLTVAPYRRPIGLRSAGAAALGIEVPEGGRHHPYTQTYPWPVGGDVGLGAPVPLGIIAVVQRDEKWREVEIDRLEPANALTKLVTLTLGASGRESETFRRLEALVRSIEVYDVCFADSHDAVRSLTELANRVAG